MGYKWGLIYAPMNTTFTLDDFLAAMNQMNRVGPLRALLKWVPMVPVDAEDQFEDSDPDVKCVRAMIQSMTPAERNLPDSIDGSRRNRIAGGSGTRPDDVRDLIRQFQGMQRIMQRMDGMSIRERLRAVRTFSQEMSRPSD